MKFKREWLQDTNGTKIDVVNELVEHSRWALEYRRVFQHEGRYYLSFYRKGSTEYQDETPYEYDGDENGELECKEVFPVLKTITVYE